MLAYRRHTARWAALVTLCLIAGLFSGAANADTLAEDNVKAGFILNFAKYTEWPSGALDGGNLRVCGLGNQVLSGKLAQMQGRQVQGHEIQVRSTMRADEWRDCHVLYIPANEKQRLEAVLRALAQEPVLIVGEGEDFARAGGMIGLKLRAGRIRFDINLAAVRKARLNLSSQLLKLADEVTQ